jgi:excisionase family DNA binding protein
MAVNPFLVGAEGPAVLVPARVAAILERHADLTALRVRVRGLDPEASAVLEALRAAALCWRSSALAPQSGTGDDRDAEPAPESMEWLTTGEAADQAGVTSRAIRRAIEDGRLPASTTAGGHNRISPEDLAHYKAVRAARAA